MDAYQFIRSQNERIMKLEQPWSALFVRHEMVFNSTADLDAVMEDAVRYRSKVQLKALAQDHHDQLLVMGCAFATGLVVIVIMLVFLYRRLKRKHFEDLAKVRRDQIRRMLVEDKTGSIGESLTATMVPLRPTKT